MEPILVVIITFGLIFVVAAALANGLSSTTAGVTTPLQQNSQLSVMLLISNFIVMPALIIGMAAIFPFPPQVKMAFCVLALTAGAPFIPWLVSLAKGNLAYSLAAVMLLTIATFIILPLALPVVLTALGTGANPSVWLVAWPLIFFMLIPLIVGMIVRARYPQLAMLGLQYLGPISLTALLVHIVLFITYTWSDFVTLFNNGAAVFAFLFPLLGMLIGYLLSPPYVLSPLPAANPHRGTKIVSAVAVAQQNTGALICCAIFALGPYTVAGDMILFTAILTIVIVMLTMAELGARYEKKQAAAPQPASPVAQTAPTSK